MEKWEGRGVGRPTENTVDQRATHTPPKKRGSARSYY